MARTVWDVLRKVFSWLPCVGGRRDQDAVELELPYFRIFVCRNRTEPARSELTVVVPRVEFRSRRQDRNGQVSATELVLNSITVVDAPRHPLAGPPATTRPSVGPGSPASSPASSTLTPLPSAPTQRAQPTQPAQPSAPAPPSQS